MYASGINLFDQHLQPKRMVTLACVALWVVSIEITYAGDNQVHYDDSDPLCGLYCIYVSLKMEGMPAKFEELLDQRYIGSRSGSTIGELQRAAIDSGLNALPVANLTTATLRAAAYPMILHVKHEWSSRTYDHFLLFVGPERGQAKIIDPPRSLQRIPFHELRARWDGQGLVVSAAPIEVAPLYEPGRRRFILYALVAVSGVCAIRFAIGRWRGSTTSRTMWQRLGSSLAQGAALCIISLGVALGYHAWHEAGFRTNVDAVSGIQESHLANFLDKLDLEEVRTLMADRSIVLVDTRSRSSYAAGHLEGALSIPFDTGAEGRAKALAGISTSARLVLYCQSPLCPYSEWVAAQLKADGYDNLALYKGGWQEWARVNGG